MKQMASRSGLSIVLLVGHREEPGAREDLLEDVVSSLTGAWRNNFHDTKIQ